MKLVTDLTTAELTLLVKQAAREGVREELAARRPRTVVKAPAAEADPRAVRQVRRSLRRQGLS